MNTHPLWNATAQFHGHECPGLAIGFRMALQAKEVLKINTNTQDEELVCISETDACCVDAIQFVLGCTLGKGNLLIKPTGKMAMHIFVRASGESCRLIWKAQTLPPVNREDKIAYVLNEAFDILFDTQTSNHTLPSNARNYASLPCAQCGELTAEPMLSPHEGQFFCCQCRPQHMHFLLP